MISTPSQNIAGFCFGRDTFAFEHELAWKYQFDEGTGAMHVVKADPPPTYYHRCFVLVRAARQFFDHARFEPNAPMADEPVYRALVRKIVSRNPRARCAESERVVIPGFDGLHSFSLVHESLLKAECGAGWESYFLRSHWRMVFPIWREHQASIAKKLKRSLCTRSVSLVHLFRFPRITINHGIALFGFTESEQCVEFEAYDPNIPAHPLKLVFDKKKQAFTFAATSYWGGGVLSVIEIYCDWPY